jgi:hypothetical protein
MAIDPRKIYPRKNFAKLIGQDKASLDYLALIEVMWDRLEPLILAAIYTADTNLLTADNTTITADRA